MRHNNKMEELKEKTVKAQGAKTEKTKNKISVTYTLRVIGDNARKLESAKIITKEELNQILTIQKNAVEKYIGIKMEM